MATLNPAVTAACSSIDADAIREIIDTDLTDAQINAMINMAWYFVGTYQTEITGCSSGGAFCEILKLLSAHNITLRDRMTKSESIASEWSVTYLGDSGEGLMSSLYGQQALQIDCSGNLTNIIKPVASIDAYTYYDWDDEDFDSTLTDDEDD